MTVTVSAAARTITAPGPVTFSPAANEVLGTPEQLGIAAPSDSTVSWSNPPGQAIAVITVTRDSTDLGQLVIKALPASSTGVNVDFAFASTARSWTGTSSSGFNLLDEVVAGGANSSANFTWRLTGTAPASGPIATQFTYTIIDQ